MTTLALGLALAALPRAGQAQPPAKPPLRAGLEALEAQLDRAVDRVSLPHAARLLGRAEAARAFRLPGYGIVLVLTPRALPGPSGHVYFLQGGELRARQLHVERKHPPGAPGTVVVSVGSPDDGEEVDTFERQVLVLQQETEAMRRAAEEEMERIVHDARLRMAAPQAKAAPPAPEAPAPAEAPAPPAAVPGTPRPVVAPAPPAPAPPAAELPGAAPDALPPPAPPPPWKNWFEAGTPTEARPPDEVVADVRAALVDALTAPGVGTSGLAGDERVTVAVDFVKGGLFVANARPERTLVVSLRAKDLAARAKGAISVEELRRRVEVNEY